MSKVLCGIALPSPLPGYVAHPDGQILLGTFGCELLAYEQCSKRSIPAPAKEESETDDAAEHSAAADAPGPSVHDSSMFRLAWQQSVGCPVLAMGAADLTGDGASTRWELKLFY